MLDLYQQLIADHVNISKVLNALESSVGFYQDDDVYHPNLALILEALDYIQAYPELFHHPLEEAVFNFLQKRQRVEDVVIDVLRRQHTVLEQETSCLQVVFNRAANQSALPTVDELDRLHRYLAMQKDHLVAENEQVFPAIADINSDEWWDIASCMVIHQDPVFRDLERESYVELARCIDSQAGYTYS